MGVSVGIDLGTTFSAVAYINPKSGIPQIIPNSEGSKLTPSVIQFLEGRLIFGSEAENAYNEGETNCVATFKRAMGEESPYCYIDGNAYTSEDLSVLLLRHLKEEAEAEIGAVIEDAVITVPAYFYSREREATIRAAEKAGIKVKKIIDEPNAAAMAYGFNHWRENANILVYDLGGGTFDVTLVHMGKDGKLSTIATRGNHKLGGRDWDARIQDILIKRFEEDTALPIRDDNNLFSIVNGMSESIKKQLSAQNMQSVKVTATFPGYGRSTVSITKREFEDASVDLLERTGALCLAVLDEAGMSVRDVTDVLLVGGSTRMLQVSNYLMSVFKKRPLSHVNPDEIVVLGAAIQSSKENEAYAQLAVQVVEGKKMTDRSASGQASRLSVKAEKKLGSISMLTLRETTAHAMGVVAIHDEDNRYYNEIIIPANHPRPVRAAKKFRFYTSPHTNNELAIYVLQGDNENPLDCQITNKYVVTGIKHVKRGEEIGTVIRIQYSYDLNGVIHIQARQEKENVDLSIRLEKISSYTDIEKFAHPAIPKEGKNVEGAMRLSAAPGQSVVHKYKAVTFNNVDWVKYDKVSEHESGEMFNEPKVHVLADDKNIEFHGYNISEMDEGVYYKIDAKDEFEIECDINTSTINPHPGGHLVIELGVITANLDQEGGMILINNAEVAEVGSRFHLKMSMKNKGDYRVEVNGAVVGERRFESECEVTVKFGFVHRSHCCELLSHAYVSDISMSQLLGAEADDNPDTETWDD